MDRALDSRVSVKTEKAKLEYRAPNLVSFGRVSALTQSGSCNVKDDSVSGGVCTTGAGTMRA